MTPGTGDWKVDCPYCELNMAVVGAPPKALVPVADWPQALKVGCTPLCDKEGDSVSARGNRVTIEARTVIASLSTMSSAYIHHRYLPRFDPITSLHRSLLWTRR
jgi:hypothetical protein